MRSTTPDRERRYFASSGQVAISPRAADLSTLRPSVAHFMRVGLMPMPTFSSTLSFESRATSSRRCPLIEEHRGRGLRDRATLAGKTNVIHPTVAADEKFDPDRVATQRVEILGERRRLVEMPKISRVPVVVEDIFFVEIVHLCEPEDFRRLFERRDENVDIVLRVVQVK
jgi:hypothetical protein